VTVADVTRVLEEAGARFEVIHHEHTESALAEANAIGVTPDEVAKTLIVTTPQGHVRAVVPANERIDIAKVRRLMGESKRRVHLTSEQELADEYPEFELGAIPPFGGTHEDPVFVDQKLAERQTVVLEAGSHEDSVRVTVDDLLRVTRAEVADICMD
jgi:Ala-tRNA(Pro) deacylase